MLNADNEREWKISKWSKFKIIWNLSIEQERDIFQIENQKVDVIVPMKLDNGGRTFAEHAKVCGVMCQKVPLNELGNW